MSLALKMTIKLLLPNRLLEYFFQDTSVYGRKEMHYLYPVHELYYGEGRPSEYMVVSQFRCNIKNLEDMRYKK